MRARSLLALGAVLALGCSPVDDAALVATPLDPPTAPFDAGLDPDDDVGPRPALDVAAPPDDLPPATPDRAPAVDASEARDQGPSAPPDAGPETRPDAPAAAPDAGPPWVTCRLNSAQFAQSPMTLDGPPSTAPLRVTVPGVPAGALAVAVHFDGHDLDHPGEEGFVTLAGRRVALPANTAWDNVTAAGLSAPFAGLALPGGDTEIRFGPGPLSRSFFRISRVSLELRAPLARCPGEGAPNDAGAPAMPTGPRAVRALRYDQATYTLRHNWVFRCDAGYAYTARGSDHLGTDCPGLYRPDGTLRGTATWRFANVAPGPYAVEITSRHSANRNARGALFRVNGEEGRVFQNDDRGGLMLFTDLWGRRTLGGEVVVVLESNGASDSVASVTLRPVP